MAYTISPNMNLIIPGVGTEAGPTYATDVNNSLTIIDAHNHTTGNGVQLTQAALNINGSFLLNDNPVTTIEYANFTPQMTAPTASNAPDSLYVDSSGNLHYINNTADVQITSGNAVNVVSSGISSGTASASFIGGVLTVYSNSTNSTPGNISGGSISIGNNTAGSNYITVSPPTSLPANEQLYLPAIPAQKAYLTLDSSGNIVGSIYSGVSQAFIASTNSATSTPVSAGSVSIVNSGNSPVEIRAVPYSAGSSVGTFGYVGGPAAGTTSVAYAYLYRNSSQLGSPVVVEGTGPTDIVPVSSICFVDFSPPAGTNTYAIFISNPLANSTTEISSSILMAREI